MVAIAGNITESLGITDWRVSAHKCKDGSLSGTSVATGTTYSVTCADADPCNVTIAPEIDYVWSAGKTVAVGDYVVPSDPDGTPHLWKSTVGGTTHATNEPTWNLSGNTTDNNVTWTYVAPLVDPVTLGPRVPA